MGFIAWAKAQAYLRSKSHNGLVGRIDDGFVGKSHSGFVGKSDSGIVGRIDGGFVGVGGWGGHRGVLSDDPGD
jgi:hypothetical protein